MSKFHEIRVPELALQYVNDVTLTEISYANPPPQSL